jgi:putrescine importer
MNQMQVTSPPGVSTSTPRLRRVLTFWDLIFYGIVVIQPTAPLPVFGIVNTVSRGHAVTAILLAMVAMMLTAFSYGRMARVYPNAGSAYTFVGRELHPNLGLLTGWSIALDYILTPTIGVIWCSKAAMNIAPMPFFLWVIFFVVVLAWVNLMGVKMNARTNTFLTIGMFTVIICFFAAAMVYLFRLSGAAGWFSTLPFYNPPEFAWSSIKGATSIAVLTYMGFDSISTMSEDVENPQRNILLATVSLCLLTGLLGGIEVYFGQLIWPNFHTYPDIDTAFVAVAGRVGGARMYQLMNATLLVATVGSSIGGQFGAARLLYAMGRDDVIPRQFFGRLEPVRNTPRNNILLIGVLALVGALLMSYQTGAELLNYGAFIAFMGVNLACTKRSFVFDRYRGRVRWIINVVTPACGFLVCLYIWWSLRDVAKITGTLWLAVGLVYCAIRTRGFRNRLELSDEDEGH